VRIDVSTLSGRKVKQLRAAFRSYGRFITVDGMESLAIAKYLKQLKQGLFSLTSSSVIVKITVVSIVHLGISGFSVQNFGTILMDFIRPISPFLLPSATHEDISHAIVIPRDQVAGIGSKRHEAAIGGYGG